MTQAQAQAQAQMDPIQAAIAAAKAAAEATMQAAGGTAVVPAGSTAVAPAAPVAPGKPLTMSDLAAGSINVDKWIKVKEFGILIGDNATLLESIQCTIDMTEGVGFVPKKSIKAGNPAQYFSTIDGVTCTSGGSWDAACEKARSLQPTAREYRCVDLPFTLDENAVDGKGNVVAEAGTRLGHTTATTNWANWEGFYREVSAAGLLGTTVLVKVGFQARSNKNGNRWGVLTFELLGEAGE